MIQDQGPGWRLKRNTSKQKYSFLIGGDDWAVELTDFEWNGLHKVVSKLVEQHEQMNDRLMREEEIFIEIDLKQVLNAAHLQKVQVEDDHTFISKDSCGGTII